MHAMVMHLCVFVGTAQSYFSSFRHVKQVLAFLGWAVALCLVDPVRGRLAPILRLLSGMYGPPNYKGWIRGAIFVELY